METQETLSFKILVQSWPQHNIKRFCSEFYYKLILNVRPLSLLSDTDLKPFMNNYIRGNPSTVSNNLHYVRGTAGIKDESARITNNGAYIRARENATQSYIRDTIQKNDGKTYARQQARDNIKDADTHSLIGLSNFDEDARGGYQSVPQEERGELEGTTEESDSHIPALQAATAVSGAEKTLSHSNQPLPIRATGAPSEQTINTIPNPPQEILSRDQTAKDNQTALDIAGTVGGIAATALL
jgi:hypothetical protein